MQIETQQQGWEVAATIFKYFIAVCGALGAREILARWIFPEKEKAVTLKLNEEAAHISKTTDTSTLTVSDQLLRQWMTDASNASIEIANLRRSLASAQICLQDMTDLLLKSVKLMRQFQVDEQNEEEFRKFEAEIKEVLDRTQE